MSRSEKPYFRYALWIVGAIVIALWFTRRSSGPSVGKEAPDFDLPVVAGSSQRFHLASERGKPVVIEVFASWCSSCERTAPVLSDAAQAARAMSVRFLGVSFDESAERARSVKSAWAMPFDVALDDGSFRRSFGITLLPTVVVIDAEGRVRHVNTGSLNRDRLEGWLAELGAPTL